MSFRRLVIALAVSSLTSCTAITEALIGTPKEKPVAPEESYLARGDGPQTRVDLGQGEEQLLTRFQNLLQEKDVLERRNAELAAEVDALRKSLLEEKEAKTAEQRLRAGAEAETERLRHAKGERELKILHLQMQIADLQRDKLQLEIAGIERQLEQLAEASAGPPTPPGTGR